LKTHSSPPPPSFSYISQCFLCITSPVVPPRCKLMAEKQELEYIFSNICLAHHSLLPFLNECRHSFFNSTVFRNF
jgi:hypothetical protein